MNRRAPSPESGRVGLGLLIVSLAISAVCVGLGIWQSRRLSARRALNATTEAARAMSELNLNRAGPSAVLYQRRVTARGRFDHAHTFILRGRVDRESPGVQVVVPLRLDGRLDAVLVNRGFVPAPDAARPDTSLIDRTEEAAVRGLALPIPSSPDSGAPIPYGGAETWRRLDLAAIRGRLPYPILDVYIQEIAPDSAGTPARWPRPTALPPLDDGPHFSYMVQWFGIAAVALVFGVAATLRQSKMVEDGRRQSRTVSS
jgi:cytochrome oxidase assembly protein ShyY1